MKSVGTFYFEDKGQDFLEWDVAKHKRGYVVVESRRFQNEIWRGTILLTSLKGEKPLIQTKRIKETRLLNYKIIKAIRF